MALECAHLAAGGDIPELNHFVVTAAREDLVIATEGNQRDEVGMACLDNKLWLLSEGGDESEQEVSREAE